MQGMHISRSSHTPQQPRGGQPARQLFVYLMSGRPCWYIFDLNPQQNGGAGGTVASSKIVVRVPRVGRKYNVRHPTKTFEIYCCPFFLIAILNAKIIKGVVHIAQLVMYISHSICSSSDPKLQGISHTVRTQAQHHNKSASCILKERVHTLGNSPRTHYNSGQYTNTLRCN